MSKRELSFVDQPDPKRPNSSLGLRSAHEAPKIMAFGQTPLPSFDTSCFPTRSNVLCKFLFERELSKQRSKKDISKQIYAELVEIYNKGLDIPKPTKTFPVCENQIIKLYDDWSRADQHQKENKMTSNEKLFVNDLPKMFDIIASNAEEQIKLDRNRSDATKKKDIDFLIDQRGKRLQVMSKLDNTYAKSVEAKLARNESLLRRQLDQSLHVVTPKRPTQQPDSLMPSQLRPRLKAGEPKKEDCESDEEVESSLGQFFIDQREIPLTSLGQFAVGQRKIPLDPDFKQSPDLQENRNSGVSLAKDPAVLQALDRTNTSSRQAFHILAPAAAALGVDIKNIKSYSTIDRDRKKLRATVAHAILASFLPPEISIVHFDGKNLTDYSGDFGDRLAIVLSGNTPDCKQGKLLSAEKISDGTGKSQADEVISSLTKWRAQDNVFGMCFDTTSSNTGWIKGACVIIEEKLGRPLLWLPCRHHIDELLLKAAWQALFGVDMEPSFTDFGKFKSVWEKIDQNNFEILDPRPWMKKHRAKVIPFLISLLESKQPRDDYRECIELVLLVLGSPVENFSFKKPGAYHKARWMAPLIYGLKMFLFRLQLKTILKKDNKYLENLERFAIFVSLFYAEHWFKATLAAEAPFMDLQMYKNMLQYKKYDSKIAVDVLKKLMGHTWYLNQEYAPLSLFSTHVSDREKELIAKKLTKVTPPQQYEKGYPNPVELPQNMKGLERKLSDSIMDGSLFLFDQLGFSKDWLYMPTTAWEINDNFQKMRSWVRNLRVTNDCAERGIKLISDFANSLTKDSHDRQNLLQVVELHRRQYSDATKATFSKNYSASKS